MHLNLLSIIIPLLLFPYKIIWSVATTNSPVLHHPLDNITVNCGSSGNSTAVDGRQWTGDIGSNYTPILHSNKGKLISSKATHPPLSPDQVPYMSARLSRWPFTYTFQVSPGQKFIRLHFYPASYRGGFKRSKDFFTVKAGPYTLLSNFSASLTADALGLESLVKEYCVNVEENQPLILMLSPSLGGSSDEAYAFVNGIEIVSMLTGLYHTQEGDAGAHVVGENFRFPIGKSIALEMVQRLNVGGSSISSIEDTGMFRDWSQDSYSFMQKSNVQPVTTDLRIKYSSIPSYTAPHKVFQTSWSMVTDKQGNGTINFAWKFPVDLGFRYLLRLHFCDFEYEIEESDRRKFSIFVNEHVAEAKADIMKWSGENRDAVYGDYVVMMEGDRKQGKQDLLIGYFPHNHEWTEHIHTILKGIEVFKMSSPYKNLAGVNPVPLSCASTSSNAKPRKFVYASGGNAIATVLVILLATTYISVYMLRVRGEKFSEKNISPLQPEGLCRRFSLSEVLEVTNNFNDEFVIGRGGFGNVYKALIDDGRTTVAIKRLNSKSKQGADEFWTEIEMLSNLRHTHLVSLIGYCDEQQEMILVYEYMEHGTLADHLYKHYTFGNGTICNMSWKQRMKACIGAARGLDYLHTGTRRGIIHRDVKTTNILLDRDWVAKISDFGLCKEVTTCQLCKEGTKCQLCKEGTTCHSHTYHVSTMVKGTFGYFDPEYFFTRRLTKKSDVYAFGVVLLEVLCGRPAMDFSVEEEPRSLALWAQQCIKEEKQDQLIDPILKDQISPECLKVFTEVANKCLHKHPSGRPTMTDVVASLECMLASLEQPRNACTEEEEEEDVNVHGDSNQQIYDDKNTQQNDILPHSTVASPSTPVQFNESTQRQKRSKKNLFQRGIAFLARSIDIRSTNISDIEIQTTATNNISDVEIQTTTTNEISDVEIQTTAANEIIFQEEEEEEEEKLDDAEDEEEDVNVHGDSNQQIYDDKNTQQNDILPQSTAASPSTPVQFNESTQRQKRSKKNLFQRGIAFLARSIDIRSTNISDIEIQTTATNNISDVEIQTTTTNEISDVEIQTTAANEIIFQEEEEEEEEKLDDAEDEEEDVNVHGDSNQQIYDDKNTQQNDILPQSTVASPSTPVQFNESTQRQKRSKKNLFQRGIAFLARSIDIRSTNISDIEIQTTATNNISDVEIQTTTTNELSDVEIQTTAANEIIFQEEEEEEEEKLDDAEDEEEDVNVHGDSNQQIYDDKNTQQNDILPQSTVASPSTPVQFNESTQRQKRSKKNLFQRGIAFLARSIDIRSTNISDIEIQTTATNNISDVEIQTTTTNEISDVEIQTTAANEIIFQEEEEEEEEKLDDTEDEEEDVNVHGDSNQQIYDDKNTQQNDILPQSTVASPSTPVQFNESTQRQKRSKKNLFQRGIAFLARSIDIRSTNISDIEIQTTATNNISDVEIQTTTTNEISDVEIQTTAANEIIFQEEEEEEEEKLDDAEDEEEDVNVHGDSNQQIYDDKNTQQNDILPQRTVASPSTLVHFNESTQRQKRSKKNLFQRGIAFLARSIDIRSANISDIEIQTTATNNISDVEIQTTTTNEISDVEIQTTAANEIIFQGMSPTLRIFSFSELRYATRDFSSNSLLGKGRFGKVYRGRVTSYKVTGFDVAVKELDYQRIQRFKDWQSVVGFLGGLSHSNLVKLLGYCWEHERLFLVYEFMPKSSLENHLFRRSSPVLPWSIRLKILIGAAQGLKFLHTSETPVISIDFNTSNLLLDGSFNSKISDFGYADLDDPESSLGYADIMFPATVWPGTVWPGKYRDKCIAPEYVATGRLDVRSDVYSFGVVLLEMLTGLRATNRRTGQHYLVDWKKLAGVMDSSLEGKYPPKAAQQLALLARQCVGYDPEGRPSMEQVAETLEHINLLKQ